MSYVVLARKWRPQRFADVLGQEHVTQTLTNAIAAQRIAHAFLFSGPRGVGKTSAARILAKALCCESEEGPVSEPCGTCRQCVEITEGRSTDIFEIDAASHTGVDNIREIIDNARYLPSSARFKIYVIDEVHMLSQGAFNALLKTLEEPPGHVKFILATTDVHKVPVTVKSRCQRYDFRRIALSRIAERLSFILADEGLEHDPSALTLVAREAEGSMRDAQSLLEQVLAFAGARPLDAQLVREALGVVDSALVDRARVALFERRPGDLIELVGDVHARGLDLSRFIGAIIEHVRDLLAARWLDEPKSVLDRPEDEIATLVSAAQAVSPQNLERLFEQLCRIADDLGRSSHPRFSLEVGLASLAEKPPHVPMEQLVGQLDRLEGLLGGPSGPGPRGPQGGPSGPGGRGSKGPRRGPPAQTHSRPEPPTGAPRAREPGRRSNSGAAPGGQAVGAKPEPPPVPEAQAQVEAPAPAIRAHLSVVPPPQEPDSGPAMPSDPDPPPPEEPNGGAPRRQPPPVVEAEFEDRPSQPRPTAADEPVWMQFEQPFARFVAMVRRRRPALAATLMQVRPLRFSAEGVQLGCETAFDFGKLQDRETLEDLEAMLGEHLGKQTRISVQRGTQQAAEALPQTLLEVEDEHLAGVRQEKRDRAAHDVAVKAVVEALSGTVANIRVLDG